MRTSHPRTRTIVAALLLAVFVTVIFFGSSPGRVIAARLSANPTAAKLFSLAPTAAPKRY